MTLFIASYVLCGVGLSLMVTFALYKNPVFRKYFFGVFKNDIGVSKDWAIVIMFVMYILLWPYFMIMSILKTRA